MYTFLLRLLLDLMQKVITLVLTGTIARHASSLATGAGGREPVSAIGHSLAAIVDHHISLFLPLLFGDCLFL